MSLISYVPAFADNQHKHSDMKNFVDSVRGTDKLNCPIEIGFKSTLLPQLGNISYRVDRVLHIDPNNGHILNDPEAQKLWSREYEKGWEVKV